jgi:hypothetical protein
MQPAAILPTCRRPKLRAWFGAVAVLLLLVAQAFATTHRLDSAAHANGDPCAICVSAASLGSGAAAQVIEFTFDFARPIFVAVERPALVSKARIRPSARGPPVASLAS